MKTSTSLTEKGHMQMVDYASKYWFSKIYDPAAELAQAKRWLAQHEKGNLDRSRPDCEHKYVNSRGEKTRAQS